jgi:hypothetical protein
MLGQVRIGFGKVTHCCINEDQKDNFVCNEYRDAILLLISNLTSGICKNKLPSILNNIFTKKNTFK